MSKIRTLSVMLTVLATSTGAHATSFTFESLNFPPSNGPVVRGTLAFGISDTGDIAGYFQDPTSRGFLDVAGTFSEIDYPTGLMFPTTEIHGVNNADQMVGLFRDAGGVLHGFLYDSGHFTQLDVPGSGLTNLTGINNSGTIAGLYSDSSFVFHGFVDAGGSFQTIDYPGALQSTIWGISDAGDVVGSWFSAPGALHGFVYHAGAFSSFDFPNALQTNAYGINNAGDVVGTYIDLSSQNHGFLYIGGQFITLDDPNGTDTNAYGINDSGQVVGYYTDNRGRHGFLATPVAEAVPEPGTLLLFATALTGWLLVRKHIVTTSL